MNEDEFKVEVLNELKNDSLTDVWESWWNARKQYFHPAASASLAESRVVDAFLIQAVLLRGYSAQVNSICPGFSERITQFTELQRNILNDLNKIQRQQLKKISLFKPYL